MTDTGHDLEGKSEREAETKRWRGTVNQFSFTLSVTVAGKVAE